MIKLQPNEHGVYPKDQAEHISLHCTGARLDLWVLEVSGTWLWGMDAEYKCGNFSGMNTPLTMPGRKRMPSDTRGDALQQAFDSARKHFDPARLHGNIAETQKQAATEMTSLIDERCLLEQQGSLFG